MYAKYYGNYDKNIKSIRGGGVITPSNPPNRRTTNETIKNTWNNLIKPSTPTPPLFKTVYYSNKNLTNGYLNTDDYVLENKEIGNYYYPSQKFDKVINLKTNKLKKKNNINPIKFPPPLITSNTDKLKKEFKLTKQSKPTKFDKPTKLVNPSKSNNLNNYIDYITNNTIYDGKYIYVLENTPIQMPKDTNNKITYLPFLYNSTNVDILKPNTEHNKIKKIYKINEHENIQENNQENNQANIQEDFSSLNITSNHVLSIVFFVLLIIYFTIYKK